jgi:hypothetical protein
MSADAGIFDQPHPDWFYTARDRQEYLRAVHRQIRRICQNSLKCKDKIEYAMSKSVPPLSNITVG